MSDIGPFIHIEFRSMKFAITQAISKELLEMDETFTKAVEEACSPENVQRCLNRAVDQCLKEQIDEAVKSFFTRGIGYTEIIRAVTEKLTERFEDEQKWREKLKSEKGNNNAH